MSFMSGMRMGPPADKEYADEPVAITPESLDNLIVYGHDESSNVRLGTSYDDDVVKAYIRSFEHTFFVINVALELRSADGVIFTAYELGKIFLKVF